MSEAPRSGGPKLIVLALAGLGALFIVVYFLLPAQLVPWLYPG